MVVGFCFVLMFFFVPETFWDRTPRPHPKSRKATLASISNIFHHNTNERKSGLHLGGDAAEDMRKLAIGNSATAAEHGSATIAERRHHKNAHHVGFAPEPLKEQDEMDGKDQAIPNTEPGPCSPDEKGKSPGIGSSEQEPSHEHPSSQSLGTRRSLSPANHSFAERIEPRGEGPETPSRHNFNSPYYVTHEKQGTDYMSHEHEGSGAAHGMPGSARTDDSHGEKTPLPGIQRYTTYLRTQPPKTYSQTLKPWNGKLRNENWFLVALRPFILFAYPAILWSTLVYSLSIGWLIVLSESVSTIYKNKETYNFTSLQTGLVYVSPFVGGIIGTAVAGKLSDVLVRFMSRRNGGIYEPEFRLVMAIPVTLSTCIGLMGFGWSAQERDNWIVPTIFFGIISFGCSLGSTTSITFAVDSYRQYAGEALVTLNFSKSECPHCLLRGSHALIPLPSRCSARPSLFPILQPLARCRWVEEHLCSHRRHSVGLLVDNYTNVHIWEKGAHVDRAKELDGKVLALGNVWGAMTLDLDSSKVLAAGRVAGT